MPDRREAILIASTNASRPSKKRILTVCVKLFLEQGYKKTTVAQIVQQASVSNSIFQNIFRAKDGVLTELAQFMFSNQFAMARSTAGTQLPPIYVYAVETAIQMTLTELNENLREIYIEAYTQKEASDYIFRETAKELYQIFSPYQPELTEQDFYFMEIGSAGIMRGFMAHPCDEALTLEKKLRTFLTMSLRSYHCNNFRTRPLRTAAASFLLRSLKHRIHHQDERTLLRGGQAQPFIQHIALSGRQSKQCLAVGKKLRERQPECIADLFQRGKRGRHALLVPGRNGRLRQAGALRKLIFRPASGFPVFSDQPQDVCHMLHHLRLFAYYTLKNRCILIINIVLFTTTLLTHLKEAANPHGARNQQTL